MRRRQLITGFASAVAIGSAAARAQQASNPRRVGASKTSRALDTLFAVAVRGSAAFFNIQ
jgi:hypothetical protein